MSQRLPLNRSLSQDEPVPLRFLIALFLTAMTTLMLELGLTRVFDIILTPNMAYMVIACTLLSFGLAGIYSTLRPLPAGTDTGRHLAGVAVLLALATVALRPALNLLPFDYERLLKQPFTQLMAFTGMYLTMIVPFFSRGSSSPCCFPGMRRRFGACTAGTCPAPRSAVWP